jgi:hypothetical protein
MKSVQVQMTEKHFFGFSATLNKYYARLLELQCLAKYISTYISVKFFPFDTAIRLFGLSWNIYAIISEPKVKILYFEFLLAYFG